MLEFINVYQLNYFEIVPIFLCFIFLFRKSHKFENYNITKTNDLFSYLYLLVFIITSVTLFTFYFDLGRIDRGTLPYAGLIYHNHNFLPFIDYGLPTGLISYFLSILFSPLISLNKNLFIILPPLSLSIFVGLITFYYLRKIKYNIFVSLFVSKICFLSLVFNEIWYNQLAFTILFLSIIIYFIKKQFFEKNYVISTLYFSFSFILIFYTKQDTAAFSLLIFFYLIFKNFNFKKLFLFFLLLLILFILVSLIINYNFSGLFYWYNYLINDYHGYLLERIFQFQFLKKLLDQFVHFKTFFIGFSIIFFCSSLLKNKNILKIEEFILFFLTVLASIVISNTSSIYHPNTIMSQPTALLLIIFLNINKISYISNYQIKLIDHKKIITILSIFTFLGALNILLLNNEYYEKVNIDRNKYFFYTNSDMARLYNQYDNLIINLTNSINRKPFVYASNYFPFYTTKVDFKHIKDTPLYLHEGVTYKKNETLDIFYENFRKNNYDVIIQIEKVTDIPYDNVYGSYTNKIKTFIKDNYLLYSSGKRTFHFCCNNANMDVFIYLNKSLSKHINPD